MKTQNIIENLINGNITDARKGAKGKSFQKLWEAAVVVFGEGSKKAITAAYFLKTGEGWQRFCDL